jgi:hypothetical protein
LYAKYKRLTRWWPARVPRRRCRAANPDLPSRQLSCEPGLHNIWRALDQFCRRRVFADTSMPNE